jgi:hypothetical protein
MAFEVMIFKLEGIQFLYFNYSNIINGNDSGDNDAKNSPTAVAFKN